MNRRIAVLSCGWSSHFLTDFIHGMMRAVEDKNIDIYLFNTYDYVEYSGFPNRTGFSIFNLINYEDFDGIVMLSDLIDNARVLEHERLRILKSKKPALTINKKLQGICCLRIDNYSGFYEAIAHLIRMHNVTDLAYISGKENAVDIAERYKAYKTVLEDNNINFDSEKVFEIENCEYHSAYRFFNDYVKSGKKLPQAFCCANDLIALALLKVCVENKIKVPEQLKIVGFDNMVETQCTKPSITTVNNNAEYLGAEAVNRLIHGVNPLQTLSIKTSPVLRQSCGCSYSATSAQNLFALNIVDGSKKKEEFDSHMETMREIFTEAADVFTLLTNIENFFVKSHNFEGTDFCIFMKSDWNSVLINSAENLPQNLTYGAQVQSICSIQDNQKYLREIIPIRDLIPAKMKTDDKSNIFLFMPIFHHSYVHGYFVTKNNLSMIDNRYGYLWTRTMGIGIEDFRKKNMFKQMSQQYLRLSTKDALSGALNRQGLEKLAKPFYAQNKKNGLTTVLFFVDINKMKHINDKFGHLHGDLAVKTVAAAVLETIPKNWLCIRYGGDEFLVVGNSKNYNGEDYCTMIKERLAKKTSVMKLPYNLSASVGTYSVPPQMDLTLEHQLAVDVVGGRVFAQHLDGAVADALFVVGDELLHVYLRHLTKAVTVGAGTVGRVEREGVGLRLGVGEAAVGIHQHAAEIADVLVLVVEHHKNALALAESRLHRLAEASGVAVGTEAVDYQFNVVHLVAVHLHLVGNLFNLAIHAHFQESLLGHLLEQFAVVALAALHQGCENHNVAAAVFRGDDFQDFLFAVLHHGLAADSTVSLADAGIEQTQQVVGVGQGAHRGARVVASALLLNGDDRRETLDKVHVWPLHISNEMPRVCREGLHVAALSLGMDGVKRQRGLPAAAQSSEHHQFVAWNLQVHVLQVVFPRA